jgi:transposase
MEAWLRAHMHAFDYWGGVPALAVPDNTRTGVSKAHRYDPDINPTYHNFAVHYGFGVLPARPYKPRDKAVVESAVQVAHRWIIAALRHRKFFSRRKPTGRLGSCSTGSTIGPSVSAMAAARAHSSRSTNLR